MQIKNDKFRLVLTGGHGGTTGIAVAQELKKRYPKLNLTWIGSEYAIPGGKAKSLEYKVFPSLGVDFYSLLVGKLQTKFTRYTVPLLLNIPLSFVQALWFVVKLRPKVVVSFGGFSSFPVIFWAKLLGIPVILHEQTVAAGRSSIASGVFASVIALARSSSLKYFPKEKTVVTGNPLMKEIIGISPKKTPGKDKTILVFAGSRGSEFINEEVFKIAKSLTKKYKLIHVTGERDYHIYKDKKIDNYIVYPYVDPINKRPTLYTDADIVIGRAGANTVSEIMYIKRPAILIPLPRTYMNEQTQNAESAREFGIAKVLEETQVKGDTLEKTIDKMFSNWEEIVSKVYRVPSPDKNATQKVVDIVGRFL